MSLNSILLVLSLAASSCLVNGQDTNPPPREERPAVREGSRGGAERRDADRPGRPERQGRPSRPGMEGAPGFAGGFHVLPPRAMEELNLTREQRKQLQALETKVTSKMEKILTREQLGQLKRMRPMMGGPGGPGMRGPVGPGVRDRDDRRGPRDPGMRGQDDRGDRDEPAPRRP